MKRETAASLLLTLALVLVYGYSGLEKIVYPDFWINFMPLWTEGLMDLSRGAWLTLLGLLETLFAILLLLPIKQIRMTGALLIAMHLILVITQTGWSSDGVQNTGLLVADLALLFLL